MVLKWALLPVDTCTESFVADDTALLSQTLGEVSSIWFLKALYFEKITDSQEVAKIV